MDIAFLGTGSAYPAPHRGKLDYMVVVIDYTRIMGRYKFRYAHWLAAMCCLYWAKQSFLDPHALKHLSKFF